MSSQSYFQEVATRWDDIRRSLFPDSLRQRAADRAAIAPGSTAVDVGAGTGFLTEHLLERGARVIAVDPSPAMLAELEAKLGHHPELETRAGDAEHLPLDDGSVEHVLGNMVLHHVDDPAAAIREMARVLAPGGTLVLTDLDTHDHEFLRTEQHDRWLGFERRDIARWLAAAGLDEVRVDGTGDTCCSSSERESEAAEVSVFVASGTRPPVGTRVADPADRLRAEVRSHYAAAARSASEASGCGCGCSSGAEDIVSQGLYGDDELAELPERAVKASLGCANPVALADLRPGETVLDLGSGGGIDVLLSARRVGPTGFAYGLDMTDEMLDLARRNQEEAGIENAAFLHGTIESIPLPDASVDVVLSNCVVNLSPDKEQTLREAFRVLKPGGRLAIADIVATRPVPSALRQSLALWSACIAGALDVASYTTTLTAAGFDGVDLDLTRTFEPEVFGEQAAVMLASLGLTPDEARGLIASAHVRARKPGEPTRSS